MNTVEGETGSPWTEAEIGAVIATYFQMLRTQELGQALNKAEHNRRLQARIPARSRGAIEFKHANISAVLMEIYDAPQLRGYLPRFNYQSDLVVPVGHALAADRVLDEAALRNVESAVEVPLFDNYEALVVDVPVRSARKVREPRKDWSTVVPVKRDYLQREARNRSLGFAGEQLVMEYEARRLHALGARSLADRIVHRTKPTSPTRMPNSSISTACSTSGNRRGCSCCRVPSAPTAGFIRSAIVRRSWRADTQPARPWRDLN